MIILLQIHAPWTTAIMLHSWLTVEDYPEYEEVNILYNLGILFLSAKLR